MPALVGSLDPGHDLKAKFLLEWRFLWLSTFFYTSEKKDSIAALSAHAPTRPIDPALAERLELLGSKLRRSSECSGAPDKGTQRDRATQRGNCQVGLHP